MTSSRQQQVGLTLIELMIAMVLGLLLMIGIIQIFLSGQQSYRLQSGLGNVQDAGRYGVFFLQDGLRQAGLPRDQQMRPPFMRTFIVDDDPALAGANPLTRDGDLNGNSPDFVTIMYRSLTNCLGNSTNYASFFQRMQQPATLADAGKPGYFDEDPNDAIPPVFLYTKDQYYIGGSLDGDISDENPPALRCRALGRDNRQIDTQDEALVDGIEDLQILYGVDTDFDPLVDPAGSPEFANAYMNATEVGGGVAAAPDARLWERVVSVRVALMANSWNNALDEPSPIQFKLLDQDAHAAFDDRRLRRIFRTTVEVRNQTP